MPPSTKPIGREEETTPTATVIPLGLTTEQYARLSAERAANASQSARQAANDLADSYQAMGALSRDVQYAKNDARDAKVIGLAIAKHLKIDLASITLTPSIPEMPVASPVNAMRKKSASKPDYVEDDESAEVTGTGNHVVVDMHHYRHLTMTEKEYRQMKKEQQDDLDLQIKEKAKRDLWHRWEVVKGVGLKVGTFVAGGVVLKLIVMWFGLHL